MKTPAQDYSSACTVIRDVYDLRKLAVLSALVLVTSCATISPHENFKVLIREGIGRNINDEPRLTGAHLSR